MRQRQRGGADRGVVGVGLDVAHEGAVELERLDRQQLQVGERGIAGAEVVDRQIDAERAQRLQPVDRTRRVSHRHRLGDFQFEIARLQAVPRDRRRHLPGQLRRAQLVRREIDRHAQAAAHALGAPGRQLPAGFVEHPGAERFDHARLLGDRNELERRDHAALRMLPADQRLDAAQLAVAPIDLRLVVDLELPFEQRRMQIAFEQHALAGHLVHARGEELEVVPPLLLGVIHRRVGVFHQGLAVVAVGRENADPDARRRVQRVPVDHVVAGERLQDLAGHRRRVRPGLHPRQHDHELVAAEPRDDVALAHAAFEAARHLDQQAIADVMPEGVVDHLEAVHVDEHQRHLRAGPARLQQRLRQAALQVVAVVEAGQRVVTRQVVDARLGRLALADVGEAGDVVRHRAGLVADQRNRRPFRIGAAVLAPVPQLALPEALRLEGRPQFLIGLGRRVAGGQDARILAVQVFEREAGVARQRLVDRHDAVVAVGDQDRFAAVLEDLGVEAQALRRVLALAVAPAELAPGPSDPAEPEQPDGAVADAEVQAAGVDLPVIRRERQVEPGGAAHVAGLVTEDGMALVAARLHEHRAQIAQVGLTVEFGDRPHLVLLAAREGFELLALPGVGRVGGIELAQADDAAADAVLLGVAIHHLAQHRGRIEQGEAASVGRLDVALRHVRQPGHRLLRFGDGHVDAAVLGAPAAQRNVLVQVGARLGIGHVHRLLPGVVQVPGQRCGEGERPQQRREQGQAERQGRGKGNGAGNGMHACRLRSEGRQNPDYARETGIHFGSEN